MKRSALLLLAFVFGSAAAQSIAEATPEPSQIPVAWELKFEPSQPLRIQVDTGKGMKNFWYVLYTVVNNTGEDIDFHPEIVRISEIETEAIPNQPNGRTDVPPQIMVDPAIVGVNAKLFAAIAQRHARTHPFLVSPVSAIGKLLQGKDNARTSVAVFPEMDPRASRFTIYFSGLSGEIISRPNPRFDPRRPVTNINGHEAGEDENPRFFVLRKTLAMPFTLPGDIRTRAVAMPVLGKMEWVMR